MSITISIIPWSFYKGKDMFLFRMKNSTGYFAELTNYGASVVSVVVPGRDSRAGNVVLGFQQPEAYIEDQCYIGSTIGRYANRISDARFTLGGVTWHLSRNDRTHSNHGGVNGFNSKVFDYVVREDSVIFTLTSDDGDEGYPGRLHLQVKYSWTDNNELLIRYTAHSDKMTVANFTNHAYFNLSGGERKVFDHRLTVYSEEILESTEEYIPTGAVVPAGNLSFSDDKIGDRLRVAKGTLSGVNSYYILDENENGTLRLAARLTDEGSGRQLMVYTTYPGLVVYTGDFLFSRYPGHPRRLYEPFDGLCLECQYYPDSPNQRSFPPAILMPGQRYNESILLKFGVI